MRKFNRTWAHGRWWRMPYLEKIPTLPSEYSPDSEVQREWNDNL